MPFPVTPDDVYHAMRNADAAAERFLAEAGV
jgi:hypothetical protein